MKTLGVFSLSFVLGSAALAPGQRGKAVDTAGALTLLKNLKGEWKGNVITKDGPAATVRYQLTSAGTTVMETLFPGTGEEMISMYYMNGSELSMKHFCAMGNQPETKLDLASSTANELSFVFAGGSNFNPTKDTHMHDGKIRFVGLDEIESEWSVFQNGKQTGTNRFFLKRVAK